MAFKVQVGPPQISIHQGQTVLISEQDGQINWPSDKGLYFSDTRVVSSWRVYANGEPWELLNGGAISYYASRIFLTNRSFRIRPSRDLSRHSPLFQVIINSSDRDMQLELIGLPGLAVESLLSHNKTSKFDFPLYPLDRAVISAWRSRSNTTRVSSTSSESSEWSATIRRC
jgi:hypothetical protein